MTEELIVGYIMLAVFIIGGLLRLKYINDNPLSFGRRTREKYGLDDKLPYTVEEEVSRYKNMLNELSYDIDKLQKEKK